MTDLFTDFVSSKEHMIRYIPEYHVCNNTAHDRLVQRECFLGRVLAAQKTLEVPTSYKTFGAYSLLSSVCGAHSSVFAGGKYPLNTWYMFVGPSAARKSSAMIPYQHVMQSSEYLRTLTISENTNSAAIRRPLEESWERSLDIFRNEANAQKFARVNGTLYIQEFHDFFDLSREAAFASFFVKLWGDQPFVRIDRVQEGHFELKNPTLSFLGAIQTLRVLDVIPLSAWRQGFFPRIVPVYSDQCWPQSPIESHDWKDGDKPTFTKVNSDYGSLLEGFTDELIDLSRSYFVCGFSKSSGEKYNRLSLPNLPIQMQEYQNRRSEHFRKLCALTAISRAWTSSFKKKETRNKAVSITDEDFEIASSLMTYNDFMINDFCKDVIRSPDAELYDRLHEHIDNIGGKITKEQVKKFIVEQVPGRDVQNLERIILNYVLKRNGNEATFSKQNYMI